MAQIQSQQAQIPQLHPAVMGFLQQIAPHLFMPGGMFAQPGGQTPAWGTPGINGSAGMGGGFGKDGMLPGAAAGATMSGSAMGALSMVPFLGA